MRLLFISDLEIRLSGGGSYAVNGHAFRQLGRHFQMEGGEPVVPEPSAAGQMVSKVLRRVLRRPGKFAFFSPGTLSRTADHIAKRVSPQTEAIFFRSATPWCGYRPPVPYFVYLDAVFHTFFHNTFRPGDFVKPDLERIWHQEANFLENAAGVFFESQWGLDRAREAGGLRGKHYLSVGRGGVIEPPEADTWDGQSLKLVSLAMKFTQKGGDIVLEAYRLLKPRFPALEWHIIGGPPEGDWTSPGGIVYEGILRPDEPAGRERLRELLAQAFLLMHPTREDTSPLVVTEAAYFGCPSISVNRFALPELVLDGKTGILLEPPVSAAALAASLEGLILDRTRYREMRLQARRHAMENYLWDGIGDRMASRIKEGVARPL